MPFICYLSTIVFLNFCRLKKMACLLFSELVLVCIWVSNTLETEFYHCASKLRTNVQAKRKSVLPYWRISFVLVFNKAFCILLANSWTEQNTLRENRGITTVMCNPANKLKRVNWAKRTCSLLLCKVQTMAKYHILCRPIFSPTVHCTIST